MSQSATDRPAPAPLTSSHWLMLLVLALVQFTNVLDFVIMMPLAPQFHDTWNLTAHQFGFLVGTYAYAACLSGLISSWFMDRLDRKTVLLSTYLLFAVANLFCALAPTFHLMLAARALAGISGGILGGIVMAIVGDLIPYARRGFATGIIMSSFAVASIVGIPFGLLLAEHYSWRYTFAVLAGVSLVLVGMAWWLLPSVRGHLVEKPRQAPWKTTWEIASDSNHLRAFILMAFLIMTTFTIVPYMPSYLVANVGIRREDVKWIYLAGGLGTLITMAPIGRASDRFGKLRVFQVLAFLAIFPLLAVTHLPRVPLYVVIIVTTCMMIFTAGRSVPAMAMATACTTNDRRGGFMSVMGAIQQFAMGLATTLAGIILGVKASAEAPVLKPDDFQPIEPIDGFPIVGWIAAVLSLATMYLATRLRSVEKHLPIEKELTPEEAMLTVEIT